MESLITQPRGQDGDESHIANEVVGLFQASIFVTPASPLVTDSLLILHKGTEIVTPLVRTRMVLPAIVGVKYRLDKL